MKPLLHTWSLAVEEQFYIVFPIFLIVVKRYFHGRWIAFTLPLALISFVISVWGVNHQPSATFYLAPTRAWELLLGSLLALGLFPSIGDRIVREALSVLGLGLIAWSVFAYSSKTPFPGLSALVPCVGAALVMHTGASGPTVVAKLLSARAIVFTGLISYSLYLWHWPLIVFAKYYWIRDLTTAKSLAVIAVSVLASVLSWRFIEKPFRKKNGVFRRSALFAGAGTVMAGSIAFGFAAQLSNGWPQRLPPDVAELSMAAFDKNSRITRCNGLRKGKSAVSPLCLLGKPDAVPSFLLWGDSQAGAMMPAIDAAAAASSQSGYYASLGGCAPLLGTSRADPTGSPVCLPFNNTVLDFLRNNRNVGKVILVGRWSENFEIERYVSNDSPLILVDEIAPEPGDNNNSVFKRAFERTIRALAERSLEVVILTQTPDLDFNAPDRLGRERYFDGTVKSDRFDAQFFHNRQTKVVTLLELLQKKYSFALVPLHPAVCDEHDCYVVRGSDVLYSDFTHLTKKGAQLTLPIVAPIFSKAVGNDLPILNETPGKYAAIAK